MEDLKLLLRDKVADFAIQKSIGSLNKLIFENHRRTNIKENLSFSSEKAQEQVVEELLGLYELSNVKSK